MKRTTARWVLASLTTALYVLADDMVSQVNATVCGPPPQVLESAEHADAIVVGEIAHGGAIHHPLPCAVNLVRSYFGLDGLASRCETGYLTVRVFEQLKGELRSEVTFTWERPVEFNNWFKVGSQLLIYADRQGNGQLTIPMCGRTMFLEHAQDDLRVLRAKYGRRN